MEKFFTTDVFILSLMPASFLVLAAMYIVSDRSITRIGVFFWGVVLIAVAGIIAWQLISWRPIGEMLIDNVKSGRPISKAAFDEFDRTSTLLFWLIPFVTGSLGTNLISDALTKPLHYKTPSSEALPIQAIWWFVKKLFWGVAWVVAVCCAMAWFLITCYTWPRKLRVHSRLYRRAYVRKHAIAKQPWER